MLWSWLRLDAGQYEASACWSLRSRRQGWDWIRHCGSLIKRLGHCERRRDSIAVHLRCLAERPIVGPVHILPSQSTWQPKQPTTEFLCQTKRSLSTQRFICLIYKSMPLWPNRFPLTQPLEAELNKLFTHSMLFLLISGLKKENDTNNV